ncbi:aspartyl/glutamyl-tRNA(Asn/Gln) amidotransferase subunit C [Clostridia bacterium]|nr:aspartyl/glutamyl-tRNA(Asn/Gln) amidotransferase subunit C [Clostridia bacterium]
MTITSSVVEYVAALSRIKLTQEETLKMQSELGAVVDYMAILNALDTDNVEPMSHVLPVVNVTREDTVQPSFDRFALISVAPEHSDKTIIVPKVVE